MKHSRVLICFFVNVFLWFLVAELNHLLAPLSISIQLDVIYLLFAGLYFRLIHGALVVGGLGLWINAQVPLPYGSLFLAYLCAWLIIVWARRRIRRENPSHVRVLAISIQLIAVLVLSLTMNKHLWGEFFFYYRLILDFSLSALILMVLAFPWCEFQRHLMLSLGWDLNAEIHRV